MADEKWIGDIHMKKGSLHRDLGIPEGQKIPKEKLEKAAKGKGKVARKARFAEELEGFHKKPSVEGLRGLSKAADEHDREPE